MKTLLSMRTYKYGLELNRMNEINYRLNTRVWVINGLYEAISEIDKMIEDKVWGDINEDIFDYENTSN